MNKKKIIISLIIVILVLLILVLFLFFKGKTVTINFKVDDIVSTVKVKEGEIVTIPDNPVKEGYIFGGFVNETGNVLLQDITLKAYFIKNGVKTSTIKFDALGGSSVDSLIIETGKNIILPIIPVKDGYKFGG